MQSRFVTYSGIVEQEIMKILGSSPIPINVPEIPSSVRAGICDALMVPAIWYVGSQLYTITRSVTPTKMRYAPGGIAVSSNAWSKIPVKYQNAIEEKVLQECEQGLNECGHNGNAKCLKAMIQYGVKEVKLTSDEIEILKKKTRPVWDKLAGKEYPRELLDNILRYLDEYRHMEARRWQDYLKF